MLRLSEIHFNHDTGSATSDALNIRLNHVPGTVVRAPEWRDGTESLPVAYAMMQAGPRVTVKAKFNGPPNSVFRVRARDANDLTPNKGGLVKWLLRGVSRILGIQYGSVLGEIADSTISFGSTGASGVIELELQGHRIKRAGVGVYQVSWIWEYLEGGAWEPFARTEHKAYILLDEPGEPWSQGVLSSGEDEPSLAWAEALELACDWAAGATNQDEAAALITKRVNSNPHLSYDFPSFFVDCCESYMLSCFIGLLRAGVTFPLNCDDCACAVATFSNLLGCQLKVGNINPNPFAFKTFRILLVGRNPLSMGDWEPVEGWGHHEVAWWLDIGVKQFVYDACLQLDLSKGLAPVPLPRLPTKMRFAENGSRGYHDYLLRNNFVLSRTGFVRKIR